MFLQNFDKRSLVPETRKQYIGYIIDTHKSRSAVWIEIPSQRIRIVKHDIGRTLKKGSVTA